jgi:hypothetical protein
MNRRNLDHLPIDGRVLLAQSVFAATVRRLSRANGTRDAGMRQFLVNSPHKA